MKASYRKTKTGYVPVVIIDKKIRHTINREYLLKRFALEHAEKYIEELKTSS
jgi:hypothetical protein